MKNNKNNANDDLKKEHLHCWGDGTLGKPQGNSCSKNPKIQHLNHEKFTTLGI